MKRNFVPERAAAVDALDRHAPGGFSGFTENEIQLEGHGHPGVLDQLVLQLAGAPAGVADDQADALHASGVLALLARELGPAWPNSCMMKNRARQRLQPRFCALALLLQRRRRQTFACLGNIRRRVSTRGVGPPSTRRR